MAEKLKVKFTTSPPEGYAVGGNAVSTPVSPVRASEVAPATPSTTAETPILGEEREVDMDAAMVPESAPATTATAETSPSETVTAPSQASEDYRKAEFDVEPLTPLEPAEQGSKPWNERQPLTDRDRERIKREAKEYFNPLDEANLGQEAVDALRQQVDAHSEAVKDAMLLEVSRLGLGGLDKDELNKGEMDPATEKRIAEVVAKARETKAKQIAAKELSIWGGMRGGEVKAIQQRREKLEKILGMPEGAYDQLIADWQQHGVDEAHGEALKEDKKYKVGGQHRAAKSDLKELEAKYGGALPEVAQMPLDRGPDGAASKTIEAMREREASITGSQDKLLDKDMLKDISRSKAVAELTDQLKQKYIALGFSEEEMAGKLAFDAQQLETWLKNSDGGSPLGDLEQFDRLTNKKEMLDARRQKAKEFLGSMLLARTIKRAVGLEKAPASAEQSIEASIDPAEIYSRGIDHGSSRNQSGGEALSNLEKADSYWGRVMAQLETARMLSRNEGTLMKSLLYMTALEKSLGDAFISSWDAVPNEKKTAARKKLELGLLAVGRALVKADAKLAEKTAASAAAGVIWSNNKLGRIRKRSAAEQQPN